MLVSSKRISPAPCANPGTLPNMTHNMKTRDHEQYEVEFAFNGRLQNSLIIIMQRLLNQHKEVTGKED